VLLVVSVSVTVPAGVLPPAAVTFTTTEALEPLTVEDGVIVVVVFGGPVVVIVSAKGVVALVDVA
jgi:hypothetical protein